MTSILIYLPFIYILISYQTIWYQRIFQIAYPLVFPQTIPKEWRESCHIYFKGSATRLYFPKINNRITKAIKKKDPQEWGWGYCLEIDHFPNVHEILASISSTEKNSIELKVHGVEGKAGWKKNSYRTPSRFFFTSKFYSDLIEWSLATLKGHNNKTKINHMSNAWSQSSEESICAFVVNNIASTLFQLDLRCGKAVFKFKLLSF